MKKIIMTFLIFSMLTSNVFAYTDESTYLWAAGAVNRWKSRGIISGYTDGTFRGNNNITRADLIIVANRLNNFVEKNNKRVAYDILPNDYFYDDMCTAVNNGLIEVDSNGNLRPREYATREDAMVIFSNLFNLSYGSNAYEYLSEKFIDGKDVSTYNMNKVAGFIESGFISGYSDGTLKPKNNITRAELIAMLDKAIKDICGTGKYSNKLVNGSVVINGKDVEIENSQVKGKIFILDGAKGGLPIISDTSAGQGIYSRIGQVNINKSEGFKTLTQYDKDDVISPVFGYIRYDETDWTNDDVKATLKLDDKEYNVINNGGKNYYSFEKNGDFIFECEKDGVIKKFTATVSNIDKVKPIIKAEVTTLQDSASISITISDDGMSPIENVAYMKGDVSGKKAISGTKIENNTFTADEGGYYTIAVKDGAGNIGSLVINIDNIYTISFNANGGTGIMANQTFINGTGNNLLLNEFINETGVFKGWATTLGGDILYTDGENITPTENMTLYAIWETKNYEIKVIQSENGNISPDTVKVLHGENKTFSITPDVGYKISDVLIDGESVGAIVSYTFDNVSSQHTINAIYVEENAN